MRVMLDDMDLAVSEVQCLSMDMDLAVSEVRCLSMDMDGREDRSLGKILKFHPAGVGHVLLTTINANFLDK